MNDLWIKPMAVALVSALATGLATLAHAQEREAPRGPLNLARASYFFVGGKIDTSLEGSPTLGQMYVEYMIPARQSHPYPIVMVHGGSQTGTNSPARPMGARAGRSISCAAAMRSTWSTRSRAAAPPIGRRSLWGGARRRASISSSGASSRPSASSSGRRRICTRNGRERASRAIPRSISSTPRNFPRSVSFPRQQELNRDALVALLDKIGPAILLTHSQSGAFNWPVADARPNLVKALVAVEPAGPPVHDIENTGAPDWFKDAERTKVPGLADVPLAYEPPLTGDAKLEFVRQEKSDKPELARCWLQKEPARRLPNLARIPIVIIVAEASYHAAYDHCTAAYLEQAGAHNTLIRLAEVGVRGNGHMMMIEKNNAAIAGVIAQWLDRQRLRERQAGR